MPYPKRNDFDYKKAEVNHEQAAKFLNISKSTFYKLIDQGVIKKADDGIYILGEVVDAYYKNLLGNKGLEAARTRLANADAEKRELEVAEMKGQMFRASDVSKAWTDNVINAKMRILAIPAKISQELEGKEAPVISQILKREIYEALNELAGYDERKITEASGK